MEAIDDAPCSTASPFVHGPDERGLHLRERRPRRRPRWSHVEATAAASRATIAAASRDERRGDIRNVELELLRSGPAHNQLLSPLTPYLALCGADGPVSVHLPFEHRPAAEPAERLRYERRRRGDRRRRSARPRYSELGAAIGRLLGAIPALRVRAARGARRHQAPGQHPASRSRPSSSAWCPFEATIAPADTSGSGAPLLLRTPISHDARDPARRSRCRCDWNRTPRLLYAFASPAGLPAVPAQAHLDALRRAIEPWIGSGTARGARRRRARS